MISGDLATVVREQQRHVRGRFGDTASYLFPARNGAPAGDRPANPAAVGKTLASVRPAEEAALDHAS